MNSALVLAFRNRMFNANIPRLVRKPGYSSAYWGDQKYSPLNMGISLENEMEFVVNEAEAHRLIDNIVPPEFSNNGG